MAVTVTVAAEKTELTTVQAVKAALGVSSSRFDKVLHRLIGAATDAIEEYVGHVFAKQTYEETVKGSGNTILMVTNVPIIGTPTVLTDSSPIIDFTVEDPEAGMLYRRSGWAVGDWVGWAAEPVVIHGTAERNFTVTYEAGYVLPGEEDRTLPKSIEQACINAVVACTRVSVEILA